MTGAAGSTGELVLFTGILDAVIHQTVAVRLLPHELQGLDVIGGTDHSEGVENVLRVSQGVIAVSVHVVTQVTAPVHADLERVTVIAGRVGADDGLGVSDIETDIQSLAVSHEVRGQGPVLGHGRAVADPRSHVAGLDLVGGIAGVYPVIHLTVEGDLGLYIGIPGDLQIADCSEVLLRSAPCVGGARKNRAGRQHHDDAQDDCKCSFHCSFLQ